MIEDYRKRILEKWRAEVYTPQNLLKEFERVYDSLTIKKSIEEIAIPDTKDLSIKEEFILLDSIFEQNKIDYCLIKTSCLDAVRFGEPRLTPDTIHIAVKDIEKASAIYKELNLKLKVKFSTNMPPKMKEIGFFGRARKIPFPVIPYLQNFYGYGTRWRKYGITEQ